MEHQIEMILIMKVNDERERFMNKIASLAYK